MSDTTNRAARVRAQTVRTAMHDATERAEEAVRAAVDESGEMSEASPTLLLVRQMRRSILLSVWPIRAVR